MFWLIFIALVLFLYPFRPLPKKPRHVLEVYFGVPGSGKTTFAAWLASQRLRDGFFVRWCSRYPDNPFCRWVLTCNLFRKSEDVWSNVPITGTYELDPQKDIGHYMILGGKIIIDEAGLEYNNRFFKTFPPEAIYFYKYHRHYETSVDVFSQSYEDMDITLRRLAQCYWIVRKSFVPFCITARRIRVKIGPDKEEDISTKYSWGVPVWDTRRIFAPPLWKLFNSYSRKELPAKEWKKW